MPWDSVRLNDGNAIPSIGFGTWKLGNGEHPTDLVEQALDVGFHHIDTAQAYRNEEEAGKAIRESGLPREVVYIATKFSGLDGKDIEDSIRDSVKNLGVKYVDLYLIHHPRLAVPDIATAWQQMEGVQGAGLAQSVGVSNFDVKQLEILLQNAKIKPAVNQIYLQPYVYAKQKPILYFAKRHGIVIEAYSALHPLTTFPGGPLDKPLKRIAKSHGVSEEEVLLAWTRAKGTVVLTSSSKRDRLERYLAAGDLELSYEDIKDIDEAGARGALQYRIRDWGKRAACVTALGAAAWGLSWLSGVKVF